MGKSGNPTIRGKILCTECKINRDIEDFVLIKYKRERGGGTFRAGRCRFCGSLNSSRLAGKKYGYAACVATAIEIEEVFTGFCNICGIFEGDCKKRLHLDHNHDTGEFRGWLCHMCNRLLGTAGDSVKTLRKAVKYLKGG